MYIENKKELKTILKELYSSYFESRHAFRTFKLLKYEQYFVWKYLMYLRKEEYYFHKNKKIRYFYYSRQKNKLGVRINVKIRMFCLGRNCILAHPPIQINGSVGDNCYFHGNVCVGQKQPISGNGLITYPSIGKNCYIGYGVIIIGGVVIGDNSIIGAGSTVVDSFPENSFIVGPKAIMKK